MRHAAGLTHELAALYGGMGMPPPDIEAGIQKTFVTAYRNIAELYLQKIADLSSQSA